MTRVEHKQIVVETLLEIADALGEEPEGQIPDGFEQRLARRLRKKAEEHREEVLHLHVE